MRGSTKSTNKGDGNTIISGDNNNIVVAPKIKEDEMYKLLHGIVKLISQDNKPSLPDTIPYTIEEKIEFNELTNYRDFFDDLEEGRYLIHCQINNIEKDSDPNFEKKIIKYIKNLYYSEAKKNITGDDIISNIEIKIEKNYSEYYRTELSRVEISYIPFVIYYVFARCKIFKKPPEQ